MKQPVGKQPRNRPTNGVDILYALDLEVLVDFYAAVLLEFDPTTLEELGCGLDTNTKNYNIGQYFSAIHNNRANRRRVLSRGQEFLQLGIQMECDTLALMELLQAASNLLAKILTQVSAS